MDARSIDRYIALRVELMEEIRGIKAKISELQFEAYSLDQIQKELTQVLDGGESTIIEPDPVEIATASQQAFNDLLRRISERIAENRQSDK